MSVYVIDEMHLAGVELLRQHGDVVLWDDDRVMGWPEGAEGVIVRRSPIRREDLARGRRLRAISKHGVGLDNVDVDAAREFGIAVCSSAGVNSQAVAEMAVALALSVARRIPEFDRMIRSGAEVDRLRYLGVGCWQKTVGVVGMGNIGTRVARIWQRAFDATILAYDPHVGPDHWSDIPHQRVSSLEEMLPHVDYLTLHVPLTAETRAMVADPQLRSMKENGIVVNAARGGVVDEADLYDALVAGKIFGAGIDVWESEPPRADHPLLSLPNVVATPHAAGGTDDQLEQGSIVAAQGVLDLLNGIEPHHRVV